jgi:NADPH-dependent 2,4-dienoyl-CoA reductase/sulfur reductase-like enzyme/rhodanese-related sulfurtransferase
MSGTRIVVLGGAFSGPAAAARARETDESAEILLLERAPEVSYAVGGLAHALSGEVKALASLESEKARFFRDVYRVEVSTGVDVDSIEPGKHELVSGGKRIRYDRLVVATGVRSILPDVEGLEGATNVFHLRRLADVRGILKLLSSGAKRVGILGGGYFGVEAADALSRRRPKVKVALVESGPRILHDFSPWASEKAQESLEASGVTIRNGRSLAAAARKGKRVTGLRLDDGTSFECDLVLVAAGVVPRTELLKKAGARLHADGSVFVDSRCATSLNDIYACGVAVGVEHAVTGKAFWQAQAAVADRTAQVAGANAAGGNESLNPMLGSSIVRAGDVVLARTGFTGGSPPEVSVARVHVPNCDPFLPGAREISLEVHYDRRAGRLLGAEAVGGVGTDKRIDVLATAIAGRLTVEDLAGLDLAYAPPFSMTRDAVNVAGSVAAASRNGKVKAYSGVEIREANDVVLVDVDRAKKSLGIPLETLRDRLTELKAAAARGTIVFVSETGRRGYLAARIASAAGIPCGYLSGGTR